MLCSVVLCCCVLLLLSLRAFVGYWSVCVRRIRRSCAVLLLAWTSGARENPVFFLSLTPLFPLSLTPPCVDSKRCRVYVQNVPCVPAPRPHAEKHVCCQHTRGLSQRTHVFFSACHTTPRTHHDHDHNHNHSLNLNHNHNHTQHKRTSHGDRDRERDRERRQRKKTEKRRQDEDKTRRKRREDEEIKRR